MINEYDFTVMIHMVDGPIDVGKKGRTVGQQRLRP